MWDFGNYHEMYSVVYEMIVSTLKADQIKEVVGLEFDFENGFNFCFIC